MNKAKKDSSKYIFVQRKLNEELKLVSLSKEDKDTNNFGTCVHTNDKAFCGRN